MNLFGLRRKATVLLGLAMALSSPVLRAADANSPWKSIFNGRDLTGWKVMHGARVEVQEGVLRIIGGSGWLRSEEEFGDCVLECDFRPLRERYDSGIYFRAPANGDPWPNNAWLLNLRRDLWGALMKGFKRVIASPLEGPDVDEEEGIPWCTLRLELRGAHGRLEIDGRKVWDTDQIDRARGFLGIQVEDRPFEFRNMRVQVLPTP